MLSAKTVAGDWVLGWNASKDDTHICPECDGGVWAVQGTEVVWHFRHKTDTECPRGHGETAEHLEAKKGIYTALSQRSDVGRVWLDEKFFGRVRPDVAFEFNGHTIGVEYQRGYQSLEDWNRRNEGYRDAGILPIWLVGDGDRWHRRWGSMTTSLHRWLFEFFGRVNVWRGGLDFMPVLLHGEHHWAQKRYFCKLPTKHLLDDCAPCGWFWADDLHDDHPRMADANEKTSNLLHALAVGAEAALAHREKRMEQDRQVRRWATHIAKEAYRMATKEQRDERDRIETARRERRHKNLNVATCIWDYMIARSLHLMRAENARSALIDKPGHVPLGLTTEVVPLKNPFGWTPTAGGRFHRRAWRGSFGAVGGCNRCETVVHFRYVEDGICIDCSGEAHWTAFADDSRVKCIFCSKEMPIGFTNKGGLDLTNKAPRCVSCSIRAISRKTA